MRETRFRALYDHMGGGWKYGMLIYEGGVPRIQKEGTMLFSTCLKGTEGQFTGLNDKNGKEIYEGDIIKLMADDGKEIQVVCEYGVNRRDNLDIPSFYFKTQSGYGSYPIVNNHLGKHDLELFEVIGNTYQHPELLIPINKQ